METQELPQVSRVDFRLAHCKEELDRIYAKQEELLANVHPNLREDFCMTRAERVRELIEQEKQNSWLLSTWTF